MFAYIGFDKCGACGCVGEEQRSVNTCEHCGVDLIRGQNNRLDYDACDDCFSTRLNDKAERERFYADGIGPGDNVVSINGDSNK